MSIAPVLASRVDQTSTTLQIWGREKYWRGEATALPPDAKTFGNGARRKGPLTDKAFENLRNDALGGSFSTGEARKLIIEVQAHKSCALWPADQRPASGSGKEFVVRYPTGADDEFRTRPSHVIPA
jgi:hypothetical protein